MKRKYEKYEHHKEGWQKGREGLAGGRMRRKSRIMRGSKERMEMKGKEEDRARKNRKRKRREKQ
jgi:hypothetical protein